MTYGTKPLTSKPGEFFARCDLGVIVKCHLARPEQKAEAQRLGLGRRSLGRDSRGKEIWAWSFPAHPGRTFETTDRAAYQAHLDEFHNGGVQKLTGPTAIKTRSPKPRSGGGGQPFKSRDDTARTCPTCGLVGEDLGQAGELWWTEHERGCALVSEGVAS